MQTQKTKITLIVCRIEKTTFGRDVECKSSLVNDKDGDVIENVPCPDGVSLGDVCRVTLEWSKPKQSLVVLKRQG
jgi:hypothetical protein